MKRHRFKEDFARDVILTEAILSGGIEDGFAAVCAVAMHMPEFKDGPDVVLAHARWISAPERQAYRLKIASELTRRAAEPTGERGARRGAGAGRGAKTRARPPGQRRGGS